MNKVYVMTIDGEHQAWVYDGIDEIVKCYRIPQDHQDKADEYARSCLEDYNNENTTKDD